MPRRVAFLLALAIPLLLYGRTAGFGFVHADDADLIQGNQAFLADASNLPRAFTRSYFEVEGQPATYKTYYRPLAIASFMLDAAAGGASPRVYHATNAVLHAGVTALLLALALAWGAPAWAALAAALLFAVHPVNVHAVAWIAGRNDLLLAGFGLLSLLAWIRVPALHPLAFAGALFSKETGLFFPLIAVLHHRLVRGERLARAHWIALACDAGVALAWTVLRGRALAGMPPELSPAALRTVGANAPQVLMHIRKMVLPVELNVAPGVRDLDLVLAAVVLVALGMLASRYVAGGLRTVAAAWFLLFLVPTLAVPGLPGYEHRAYVPLAGLLVAAAAACAAARRLTRPVVAAAAIAALLVVFATLSTRRLDVYRDPFAYWTDAAADRRFGPLAHVNLGQLHEAAGRPEAARREYLQALQRDPNTPKAHNNLGVVLMALNEPEQARRHFEAEVDRHPWNADAWFNLGLWAELHGQPAEARRHYERALAADPAYEEARRKLREGGGF